MSAWGQMRDKKKTRGSNRVFTFEIFSINHLKTIYYVYGCFSCMCCREWVKS